jgi:hypothetical protein
MSTSHSTDSDRTLHLTSSPNPAFVDQPIHLLLTGALPSERVRLTAWLIDDAGRRWESRAKFTADATGTVDPARDAPLQSASPYRALDPMGLFWSMQLNPDDAGAGHQNNDQYLKRELTPTEITIEASAPSLRHIARLRIERHHIPPNATIRAVDGDHQGQTLAGLLFIPAGETPDPSSEDAAALPLAPDAAASPRPRNYKRPAIITLGGSGGGLDWETGAALCAHGYAALALPYFGFDPLPSSLNSIPLEYFERAIAWLCRQPEIDPGRLAIHGISRGGELALLLATRIPLIRAVVGVVPGNVVWQATGTPPPETAADLISNFHAANSVNLPPNAPDAPAGPSASPINTSATGVPPAASSAITTLTPNQLDPAAQTSADSSTAASSAAASLAQPDSPNPSSQQAKPPVPIKRTPGNHERSSWTYRGSHLPFVPYAMARFRILTAIGVISFRRPVRFVNLHRDSLRQKDAAVAAEIPVENAAAAILLISAEDDQVWPSENMSDAIVRRLTDHHYPHEFTHLKNPGAGHLLRLPHTPATTASSKLPNFGLRVAFGGNPADTAAARLRAWLATLSFLSRNLN